MRKLILSMMVSLDTHIARTDGDIEWFLSDAELEREMLTLLDSVDAMIFGRVSYELLAAFWPTAGTPGSEAAPGGFSNKAIEVEFVRLMNTIPKVVYSRTLKTADWGPVTIENDVNAQKIDALKQQPGKDLVLFAGARLASAFANQDLFDEYRLMVHPAVLGKGMPLFGDLSAERKLKLQRARPFPSGVVLLQYSRDR